MPMPKPRTKRQQRAAALRYLKLAYNNLLQEKARHDAGEADQPHDEATRPANLEEARSWARRINDGR